MAGFVDCAMELGDVHKIALERIASLLRMHAPCRLTILTTTCTPSPGVHPDSNIRPGRKTAPPHTGNISLLVALALCSQSVFPKRARPEQSIHPYMILPRQRVYKSHPCALTTWYDPSRVRPRASATRIV